VILRLENGYVESHVLGKSSDTTPIPNLWRRTPTQYLTDPILYYLGEVIAAVLSADPKLALTSVVEKMV
jgi:hypothetical protein